MNCNICGAALTEDMERCPLCASPVEKEIPLSPVPMEEPPTLPVEEAPVNDWEYDADGKPADFINTYPDPGYGVKKLLPVLIPVAVMAVLLIVGTCLFFLRPRDTLQNPQQTAPTAPAQTKPPAPPASGNNAGTQDSDGLRSEDFIPTDEHCFRMTSEGLVFLAERYDGGKVLVIPNEIDGVIVTAIAPGGFQDCQGISTVILPDSLTDIGECAFAGCEDIRGLWLPDSMRRIGQSAFEGCIGIESVAVPGEMEFIGENAFTGCARLLYFFYDGYFEDWCALYNEYVTPFTSVSCLDGDYYHGVETP